MRLYTGLLFFLQTPLRVSDDTLVHHQEHTQTVITSGTGRTVFATVRWRGGVVPIPPHQRTVANAVRPVPDVITVCVRFWWWVRVSSETRRVVCRNIIKLYIVAFCWAIIDNDGCGLLTFSYSRVYIMWRCLRKIKRWKFVDLPHCTTLLARLQFSNHFNL